MAQQQETRQRSLQVCLEQILTLFKPLFLCFSFYRYANGDVFEGEFLHGMKQGMGKYTYNSGDVYEGDFSNSKMHGKGTFSYKNNGSEYTGEFKNGAPHGMGLVFNIKIAIFNFICVTVNIRSLKTKNYTYAGSWQNGMIHGDGSQIFSNGNMFNGISCLFVCFCYNFLFLNFQRKIQ
jgi:hypothetical protein